MSDVHEALKNLVERLHDAARENLESITLYGSAARGDFHEAHSDLNVLCILRSLRAAQLARVSGVVKWWTTVQHQTAPLFFSAEELRQKRRAARSDVAQWSTISLRRKREQVVRPAGTARCTAHSSRSVPRENRPAPP